MYVCVQQGGEAKEIVFLNAPTAAGMKPGANHTLPETKRTTSGTNTPGITLVCSATNAGQSSSRRRHTDTEDRHSPFPH